VDYHEQLTQQNPAHHQGHRVIQVPNSGDYSRGNPTIHVSCVDCEGDNYLARVPVETIYDGLCLCQFHKCDSNAVDGNLTCQKCSNESCQWREE
jgi:hypothetical protein